MRDIFCFRYAVRARKQPAFEITLQGHNQMTTEQLIYSMLTENTGSHPCDSGGINGRGWQRNQAKSLDDFRAEPEATLNIDNDYFDITVSLFHYLTSNLQQNELCKEFNEMPCDQWNGEYYGTSNEQQCWLEDNGFLALSEFNSYNWDSNLSQVIQGTRFERDGDYYVLLQIHNGADVRGGYTDAKLFLVNADYFLLEDCTFEIDDVHCLDVHGSDLGIYNRETGDTQYLGHDDLSDIRELAKDKTEFIGSIMAY